MTVVMPPMSDAQAASWHGLMALHDKVPAGWTLVGGQMVHLHCAERGQTPDRPTTDIDAVVDVRASPDMFRKFTSALLDLGFKPHTSGEGLQHRWCRGLAQIDVLMPDGVGQRAAARPGAGGAPTLPTPGGSQALIRTEPVRVDVAGPFEGRTGMVLRPNLVGALVMKAAAHGAPGDAAPGRHRRDFVVLAGLIDRRDFRDEALTRKDRQRLQKMVASCRSDPLAMEGEHASTALERLEAAAKLS